jgi:alkanesulfonate monooxygenase SsuD/methylene tetrahydromethanopterin reductase-like flavin-dependent oxidoreductase (luciferase family)
MTTPERPLQFALDFSHHAWERGGPAAPSRTLQTAQAADQAGIDAIWVSEDPEGWDAFALLGALATVTTHCQLGTSVTSPWPRNPNLLAASVATLDQLSGGRAVLGLGRGQVEWHRDVLGVETGSPLSAMRETITLLRAWWQPPFQAASPPHSHFRIREWERSVAPLLPPPIYLAAAGPQTLALAGELADGVIFNVLTSEEALREAIPLVRQAAITAGRDPDALAIILRSEITVTHDDTSERKALTRAKSFLALLAGFAGMSRLYQVPGYDTEAIIANVRAAMRIDEVLASGGGFPALRRTGDLAAARAAVPDAFIRALALVGNPEELAPRLAALRDLGVTCVSVTPPPEAESVSAWEQTLATLRELAS